ncbi:hypothetical protein Tco_0526784 [Tanacetum coccineum]
MNLPSSYRILGCNSQMWYKNETIFSSILTECQSRWGNHKTLKVAIEEFSADATRFSLANAGGGTDNANFVFKTADDVILWLTKEKEWIEEILADESSNLRVGPHSTFADRAFANK